MFDKKGEKFTSDETTALSSAVANASNVVIEMKSKLILILIPRVGSNIKWSISGFFFADSDKALYITPIGQFQSLLNKRFYKISKLNHSISFCS